MSEYPQPGLHPDADTLSAFVEGVLPEHERAVCLAHFADCAACREVVWLTQEPLAPEPVPAPAAIAWWKRWLSPVPALSVAAVAGILVLSVALLRIEKPAPPQPAPMVAMSEPKKALESPMAPPITAPVTSPLRPPHAAAARAQKPLPKPETPRPEPATADTVTVGSLIPGAAVTVQPVTGAPVTPAPTAVAHAVTFEAAAKKIDVKKDEAARSDSSLAVGTVADTVQVTASSQAVMAEQSAAPAPRNLPLNGRTAKAPLLALSRTPAAMLPGKAGAVTIVTQGKIMLSIDSSGALFRSDNAGKTWEAVKPSWPGKAVELSTVPDDPSGAVFRLKTDSAAVWTSRDGTHWLAAVSAP